MVKCAYFELKKQTKSVALCMINNYMVDFIYQMHSHRIIQWNDTQLNPRALDKYATAIAAQGSPLENCFGFIDGTVRRISKPGLNQKIVYNGHKGCTPLNSSLWHFRMEWLVICLDQLVSGKTWMFFYSFSLFVFFPLFWEELGG